MNDIVIEIEVVLNYLNTLLSKAVYFKDEKIIGVLHSLKHTLYYKNSFEYTEAINQLKEIELSLNQYE